MRLHANGTDYVLHFTHHYREDPKDRHKWTRCILHEGKCEERFEECVGKYTWRPTPVVPSSWGIGVAFCSPDDQFSKATGRKVSLARALKMFQREKRRGIWTEYFRISPFASKGSDLRRLLALSDEKIDTSDIPETDFSKGQRGRFYKSK